MHVSMRLTINMEVDCLNPHISNVERLAWYIFYLLKNCFSRTLKFKVFNWYKAIFWGTNLKVSKNIFAIFWLVGGDREKKLQINSCQTNMRIKQDIRPIPERINSWCAKII